MTPRNPVQSRTISSSMAMVSRKVKFKGIDPILEDLKTDKGTRERRAQRMRKKVSKDLCGVNNESSHLTYSFVFTGKEDGASETEGGCSIFSQVLTDVWRKGASRESSMEGWHYD